MIKYYYIAIALLLSLSSFGQETELTWDQFDKLTELLAQPFKTSVYSLNIQYKTFKGKQTTTPYEVSEGFIQKSGNKQYGYIHGITTISTKTESVTIDANNKMVAISSPKNTNQGDLLAEYKKTRELVTKISQTKKGDNTTIAIVYNKKSPISKILLKTTNNNTLKSTTVFYAQAQEYIDDFGEMKSDYVVLQMNYLDFVNKKIHQEIPLNKILSNTGDKPSLIGDYKNFELIDLRLKN